MEILKNLRGQIDILRIVIIASLFLIVVSIIPAITYGTTSYAISSLEGKGYIVLASGEYSDLLTLLQSVDTKADAAVSNAEAAVVAAENAAVAAQIATTKIDLFNSAESLVFPETTAKTVTFTAGGGDNTFGTWAEITDSAAVTLSSKFAANDGYLSEILPYIGSVADKLYLMEISYGDAKTVVGRVMFYGTINTRFNLLVKSEKIPAGETLYYRMMCETGAATCKVILRYFYE